MSAALQMQSVMSDSEWHTRCELAALYHVVNELGLTDLINTHMSARVPNEPNHFLINNYGEMFDEITASSLVKTRLSVVLDDRAGVAGAHQRHCGSVTSAPSG